MRQLCFKSLSEISIRVAYPGSHTVLRCTSSVDGRNDAGRMKDKVRDAGAAKNGSILANCLMEE